MQLVQGRARLLSLGLAVFCAATIPHSGSELGCTTARERLPST